jgi:hypothetical protein
MGWCETCYLFWTMWLWRAMNGKCANPVCQDCAYQQHIQPIIDANFDPPIRRNRFWGIRFG